MDLRGLAAMLVALGVLAATALVFSTGAAIVDGPADPLNDAVALQPGDNPYTYLDDDGELVIDVTEDNPRLDAEGVNVGALTVEDDLFYVVHNGSEPAEVWIEHDSPAVTFLVRGEPAESGGGPAIVTPGDEAVPVGVEVDTRVADLTPGDRVLDEISVHARPADPEAIEQGSGDDGNGDGDDEDENGDENGDGDETGGDEYGDGDEHGGDETGDDPGDSDDPGTVVTVESPDSAAREVEVLSVTADTETEIDLRNLHVGDPTVRLGDLTFVRDESGNVEFEVRGTTDPPPATQPVPAGVDPLGYYTVTFAESDRSIAEATATLSLDRDRLAAAGVAPERLAVYRETDAGWERAEMRVVDDAGETVRLRAVTGGFSAFAVAAERPALIPVEASLSDERVAPGEPLTVALDVKNVGAAAASGAEFRVETEEGVVVSDETVTVDAAPGAAATESVTVRFDEPGEYDLVLAGEAVEEGTIEGEATLGSAAVTEGADGTGTDGGGTEPSVDGGANGDSGRAGQTGDDDRAVTELSNLDPANYAGLVALVAIVLATLFLVRRAPR